MKPTHSLRATLSSAWKDLQVIFKDRGGLVVIILLPSVFSILFGSVNQSLSSQADESIKLPVVLVNQDSGVYGEQMAKVLASLDILDIQALNSPEEAEQQVLNSKAVAAILIPPELSSSIDAYQPSQIDIIVDPTQETFSRMVPGILTQVVSPFVIQGELSYGIRTILADYPVYQQADEATRRGFEAQSLAAQMAQVQKMTADPWIRIETRTQDDQALVIVPPNLFSLVVPSFTVLFAFFIVGAIASELLRERQQGSLRRLVAAPIRRWNVIAGKMLAYMVLILVQVALIFGGASFLFNMPLGDSLLGLLLVTLAMGLAATGMGMMIAALSKTDRQADSIGLVLGFVLGGLGGCFVIGSPVPLYKSGGLVETLSKLTPQAHALLGYDALLNQGAGLVEVLPEVGILCGFALVFLVIASLRFKYET